MPAGGEPIDAIVPKGENCLGSRRGLVPAGGEPIGAIVSTADGENCLLSRPTGEGARRPTGEGARGAGEGDRDAMTVVCRGDKAMSEGRPLPTGSQLQLY